MEVQTPRQNPATVPARLSTALQVLGATVTCLTTAGFTAKGIKVPNSFQIMVQRRNVDFKNRYTVVRPPAGFHARLPAPACPPTRLPVWLGQVLECRTLVAESRFLLQLTSC